MARTESVIVSSGTTHRVTPGHLADTDRFTLRTFGRLALIDSSGREDTSLATRPRKLAVLAWLALRPQRRATRDSSVGVFWAERDEERARNSLSDAISHLRRVLGRDALRTQANEIVVADDAPLVVDALELCTASAAGDHERVVALYQGAFLDGFYVDDAPEFDDWRDRERTRYARLFAKSAAVCCQRLSRTDSWTEWRALAERWLDTEPACTEAALSLLHSVKGPATRAAHAEVLATYESLARRMEREIGIAPDPRVTEFAMACASSLVIPGSAAIERLTVGRDRERAALRQCWERAAAGRGMLVNVSGEPGIGKTTLVEDTLGELTLDARPPRVARGRCSERLAGTDAYLPILDALDGLLRAPGADIVARLMKRFAPTWYLNVAPADADNASDQRALANVQASSQGRMKRELAAFIEELSRIQPLVLFFDDLHWCDVSTIDVLAYLAPRLGTLRLLLLTTVRPAELLLANHPFVQLKLELQARGLCREVALDFLSAPEVSEFVDREFPDHALGAGFAAMIHAKTEGNPLFMADLVRYLRAQGTVSNTDGVWRVAAPLSNVADSLPESIRGMIQRKIERLTEADRKLLAAASVQGYLFDTAIVAALTGSDPADVEERLDSLERVHGFVRRVADNDLPNGTVNVRYRFVHVLYQNSLFASLAPSRRASLSASVAAALVSAYGDRAKEIAADLAELFEAARDTSRAIEQLAIAADAAARLFANQEVSVLARRALASLATQPETNARIQREISLLTTLGVSLGAMQGMAAPEVGAVHARAYELWKRIGSHPSRFSAAGALWTYHVVGGQLGVGIALGDELLRMAEATGEHSLLVAAHQYLGITLHHLGDHRQARERFERVSTLYSMELRPQFSGLPLDPAVGSAAELVRVLWVLGYPDRAVAQLGSAMRLAEQIGHPESVAFAGLFGAFLYHLLDEPAKALEYADRVLAVSRERDIATTLAWGTSVHGWALAATGQLEAGIAELQESLAGQRAAGAEVARPQFAWMLGDLFVRAGRYEDADNAADDGLTTAARTGDQYWDSELRRLKGELVLLTGGSPIVAEQHFRAALVDAAERGAKSLELRAATALARLCMTQDRAGEAERILMPVYAWFDEGFETADLIAAGRVVQR